MKLIAGLVVCLLVTPTHQQAADDTPQYFGDLDTVNAKIDIIIPVAVAVLDDITPSRGDASLFLRLTTLLTNAGFDAVAPYHATAVGVYSRIERRPASERTYRNANIALLYAHYLVFLDFLPARKAVFDQMLTDNGLDPETELLGDLTSPHGIGYYACQQVLAARANDGFNMDGDFGRDRFFKRFTDTTGYEPVNTAYDLNDPSRWQPDLQVKGVGLYKIQQFVTPQWAVTEPYTYADPNAWQMPEPVSSHIGNWDLYKKQADEVLAASAALTDAQKLDGEFFDNKGISLGRSNVAAGAHLGPIEFAEIDFLTNLAAHDAGVFVWNEKRRWDGVRPFSAIRHIYGDGIVEAYGGPGVGTVNLTGNEWSAYQEEADHPEYPSASTCFCYAHSQVSRLYHGSDSLNFTWLIPAGGSVNEPGITPEVDTSLFFPTWTDLEQRCGASRVVTGVHFWPAVDESAALCGQFGDFAFDWLQSFVNGTAPMRGPATRLPVPPFF